MSTALTVYEPETGLEKRSTYDVMPMVFSLAEKLHTTDFVPSAFRNKPAALAACMLAGHELGLPPLTAIQHVFSIEGRIGLTAAMQRGLILAHGHQIWIEEQNSTRAIVCARRRDMPDHIFRSTWTMDRAKTANLSGKAMWRLYPENMLVARATSEVARAGFMDVLGAMPYSKEELEDGDFIDGTARELPPGEASGAPARTTARARARRAATRTPEPEPSAEEVEQAMEALGQGDRSKVVQAPEDERAALAVKLWKRMPAAPPVEPEPSPQLETTAARAEPPPVSVEPPPEGGAAEPTIPEGGATTEDANPEGSATGSGSGPQPSGIDGYQAGEAHSGQSGLSSAAEAPVPAPSSGGPQSSAAERLPQENRSLQQQVAIACKQAGFSSDDDRHRFVKAVTGKESGSKLNRAEALSVIEVAGAVQRGEQLVKEIDGVWHIVSPEASVADPGDASGQEPTPAETELNIPGLGVIRHSES